MKEHKRRSRPVLFFREDSEYPYWGKGSSFFVSSENNVYWITARHVMENQCGAKNELMITSGHNSAVSVLFSEMEHVEKILEYEDFQDIYILRVNIDELHGSMDTKLYAWNINEDFFDNTELSIGDDLFLLGYPSESRFVEYETKNIESTKVALHGFYQGPSSVERCHKLRLVSSISLDNFDGLSGGVVFRYPVEGELPIQLVGMMIRGSSQSGLIHFIDSSVINDYVRSLEAT